MIDEFDIAPNRLQDLISQVEINYVDHDGTFWGCVSKEAEEDNNGVIYVSEFFPRRIGVLLAATDENNQIHDNAEYRILIVFLAVCLLHKLAHLMNRWQASDGSAKRDFEAGLLLEDYLFGSELYLAFVSNKENPALHKVVGNHFK